MEEQMEEQIQQSLKTQRERRQRISRIKTGLVTFIAVWMVVSMTVMTVLTVKVISLQRQINVLTGEYAKKEQVEATRTEAGGSVESGHFVSGSGMSDAKNLADETDVNTVYLTFDDGPSSNSHAILDILKQYNVKATFFLVGKGDEESRAVYRRIVEEGHTLGMHSYTHKYSEIYASLDSFAADFDRIHDLLYDATGQEPTVYRFPGGSSNKVSNTDMREFIQYINDKGVTYFDWNVSSGDATAQAFTPDELVENVMQDVVKYKTSVVLMHDAANKSATVQALPQLIETLQARGMRIAPITESTPAVQHVTITK